ncbi:MAG: SMI1/KNR4 family protein [Armatimonadota bacterium]
MAYPVAESRIEEAERELGRRLPEKLRNRLLADNGGETTVLNDTWTLYPVWDPSDRKHARKTANHILYETDIARGHHGFPPDAIAIAGDSYGNRLIVPTSSDRIEFWDHETGKVTPVKCHF